jgi:hypothetical protein
MQCNVARAAYLGASRCLKSSTVLLRDCAASLVCGYLGRPARGLIGVSPLPLPARVPSLRCGILVPHPQTRTLDSDLQVLHGSVPGQIALGVPSARGVTITRGRGQSGITRRAIRGGARGDDGVTLAALMLRLLQRMCGGASDPGPPALEVR